MLVDLQIREAIDQGRLRVEPADGIEDRIQPASLDVRLGDTFATLRHVTGAMLINPMWDQRDLWQFETVDDEHGFSVHPGQLVLASTLEKIALPNDLAASVTGKSSLGRLGVQVHVTAGHIDPGWPLASITLEISTVIGVAVALWPGMPIAQLVFHPVSAVAHAYHGKYVGQDGDGPSSPSRPALSRFHENWDDKTATWL